MNGFNKVILAGNLTRDPEERFTQNGTPIAKSGLAINRRWNTEGERKEETTFVDWTAFGPLATTATQHLRKGSCVLIEGRLTLEQWQDQQGNNRQKLSVIAEQLTFLPSGEPQQQPPPQSAPKPARAMPQTPKPYARR